jgi:hypothetical protein
MNLAFPALMIVVLLSPGLIFTWGIKRWLDLSFEQSQVLQSIPIVVFASAVLHLLGAIICTCIGSPISYESVLVLLQGGPDSQLESAIAVVANSLGRTSVYFFCLLALGCLIGILANRFLFWYRPDLHPALSGVFTLNNSWFYYLSGDCTRLPEAGWRSNRRPDIVRVSAVIPVGEATYLYCGLLADFFCDRSGNLDRLVLVAAMRRRMCDDRSPDEEHNPDGDDRYYPIIGHRFVICYSRVSTLNFQYAWLEEAEQEASSGTDRSPASDA